MHLLVMAGDGLQIVRWTRLSTSVRGRVHMVTFRLALDETLRQAVTPLAVLESAMVRQNERCSLRRLRKWREP
jgi:hypothetical protein